MSTVSSASATSPLAFLLETRLQQPKACFLCGRCQSSGNRFISISDIKHLYKDIILTLYDNQIFSEITEKTLQCLIACNYRNFDEDSILSDLILIANDIDNSQPGYYKNTAGFETNKIFTPRKKGVQGGLPICWRDCALSERLNYLLNNIFPNDCKNMVPSSLLSNSVDNKEKIIIRDEPFDLGYITYNSNDYKEFFASKVSEIKLYFSSFLTVTTETLFNPNLNPNLNPNPNPNPSPKPLSNNHMVEIELFTSPEKNFRQRCRFAVERNESENKILFLIWEENGWPSCEVENFPIACTLINELIKVRVRVSALSLYRASSLV
jgi:hypothetical protein